MLTDTQCRKATCPAGSPRLRIYDGGSLYLEVAPTGSKRWFFKYYPDGKEDRKALGVYPAVTLKAARQARDDARRSRGDGTHLGQQRKAEKLAQAVNTATTFEAVAREFHATKVKVWSVTHAAQWMRCMEKDVFPRVGSLPLADLKASHLLDTLKRVQARGATRMGHDLREWCGQVFGFGVATGRCDRNPAADLRGALEPYTERHMSAVLDPGKAGELMRAIDAYAGQPTTRAALVLSALTFQRPGNIRAMEWTEIDAAAALWTIPAAKMKRPIAGKINGKPHLVPLSPQALTVLADLRPLTGHGRYVFPCQLTGERPMSENTVRTALRRMGYSNADMTPHGFRAMARTLMGDHAPGIAADVIEAQLAHGKSGPLGMAYDRTEYPQQRRAMMNTWADYLDMLRTGAIVLPFKAA